MNLTPWKDPNIEEIIDDTLDIVKEERRTITKEWFDSIKKRLLSIPWNIFSAIQERRYLSDALTEEDFNMFKDFVEKYKLEEKNPQLKNLDFEHFRSLKTLDFSWIKTNYEDIRALKILKFIEEINLWDTDLEKIPKYLWDNRHLTKIGLYKNNMHHGHITWFEKYHEKKYKKHIETY